MDPNRPHEPTAEAPAPTANHPTRATRLARPARPDPPASLPAARANAGPAAPRAPATALRPNNRLLRGDRPPRPEPKPTATAATAATAPALASPVPANGPTATVVASNRVTPMAPAKASPGAPTWVPGAPAAQGSTMQSSAQPTRLPPEPKPKAAAKWPKGVDLVLLAGVAITGLVLRLREPLSSGIMGAEDPYRHMERAWDLAQGHGIGDYPPGLTLLLLPFTWFGAEAFYDVARFLPVAFGVGMVVAMFFLVRPYTHPAGALAAALLVAAMPEMVRRTDLLFPTALDLALLPVFFLTVLKASEGSRKGLYAMGGVGAALLIVHPWVAGLLVAPLVVFWLLMAAKKQGFVTTRQRLGWRAGVAGGMLAVGLVALQWLGFGPASKPVVDHAFPRLAQLASNPASITPLPLYVDLPEMLTLSALILAGLGAALAIMRRNRFGLLALLWSAFLLPIVFVDWLGLWYIPHRTVAYLGLGVAMLAGLAVSELFRVLADAGKAQLPVGVGFGILLIAFVVPAGAAIEPWYRIYDEDDQEAWAALDEMGTSYVVAGSWQGRMGYRALTGNDAVYNPGFFDDETVRDYELNQRPDLVVLIDDHAREAGTNTDFLADWHLVGEWGGTSAYTRFEN